ncbi:MAG: 3-oxoacyl-[acyl-carrier-protein] reductase [Deltaproteobacteria bacterium RBG_13_49_15]|nr:MAG: 3-oxoacyl-[acyl-carrier-protein] reductase [Deltaproteobacteria bacterium RBG_13_49_15]
MENNGKRIVVVTGGSRGIGRAICLSFTNPDTMIYFNYFSPADPEGEKTHANETERLIRNAGGASQSASVNVMSEAEVKDFFDRIISESRRIDVLVNNAGITKDKLLIRMTEKDWDDVLDINLKGTFHCTRFAVRAMINQRYGRIINIASIVGVIGNAGQANYVASKAGIIGLTKATAKEFALRGITVNAIAPGFIETDMTALLPEKIKEAMLSQIPLGRPGKPEDVAGVVAFLASGQADYITGQVIHVSGGMYI